MYRNGAEITEQGDTAVTPGTQLISDNLLLTLLNSSMQLRQYIGGIKTELASMEARQTYQPHIPQQLRGAHILGNQPISVGKAPGSTLRVPDHKTSVSRHHLQIGAFPNGDLTANLDTENVTVTQLGKNGSTLVRLCDVVLF